MSLFFTAFISPGGSEFLLIMLVLILLFGAKDAPRIFRSIHNALDKMQRAAASFRYKIMYGDLYQDQNTTHEEPYDVDADYPDDDDHHWESGDNDQESDDRGQESEVGDQETENKNQKSEPTPE